MPTFRVKRLRPDAIIPERAHETDAGLDLYAFSAVHLEPNTRALVPTGIAVEIPRDYAGLITPRSGLALKYGLSVLNTPGLIDSGYTGEVGVIVHNVGYQGHTIKKGDKIAQLVIISTPCFMPIEVDGLKSSERGEGGFGSTDRPDPTIVGSW